MTQQEYENKIKELEKQIAELKMAKVEEPQTKRWKPNEDETYWFISSGGVIANTDWCGEDTTDDWYYITGNCFKTKEEAEEYKKQIEHTARYKNYIEEHNELIDWSDCEQIKYYASFDYKDNNIRVGCLYTLQPQGSIYASRDQIIKDAINEIGEENFKKYVLGVK